jgi:hypothetical protein
MVLQQDRVAEDEVTKLLDINASDKIQILNAPVQLPGVCGICGTSRTDDRDYIDIGLWFEMYGQFYFCTFCMTQMVNRLGGLTPEQAEELQAELNQARQAILEFQETKARVDGAIESLRNTGLFADPGNISVSALESVDSKQDAKQDIADIARNKQDVIRTDIDTPETPSSQGSDGVSSTGSNELDSWL